MDTTQDSKAIATQDCTPKQASFAEHFVKCGDATQAYKLSLYDHSGMKQETITRTAFDLVRHPAVAARIAQLRASDTVTVQSITQELQEDRELARSLGQVGSAITATRTVAQIHGILDTSGGKSDAASVLGELARLVEALDHARD